MFSAAVPLDTATACAASCAAANASSNRALYGPSVSAPLARISATAAAISARSAGGKTTRAAGTPNAWPLAQLWRGPAGPPLVTGLASGIVPDLAIIPVELPRSTVLRSVSSYQGKIAGQSLRGGSDRCSLAARLKHRPGNRPG